MDRKPYPIPSAETGWSRWSGCRNGVPLTPRNVKGDAQDYASAGHIETAVLRLELDICCHAYPSSFYTSHKSEL